MAAFFTHSLQHGIQSAHEFLPLLAITTDNYICEHPGPQMAKKIPLRRKILVFWLTIEKIFCKFIIDKLICPVPHKGRGRLCGG